MEQWLLIAIGLLLFMVIVTLRDINQSLANLSQQGATGTVNTVNTLSDLPKEIAKAIIWEVKYDSTFTEDIARDIGYVLPEKIATKIAYELITERELPEKIAKAIHSELRYDMELHEKIGKSVRSELGYLGDLNANSSRPSNLREHLEQFEWKLDR